MSEVKKPREWRLLDAGLNQNINGLKQEFRIAMYQENFGLIEGVTIPVIEKSAFDKAIEALKFYANRDNYDREGVCEHNGASTNYKGDYWVDYGFHAREALKELGCE